MHKIVSFETFIAYGYCETYPFNQDSYDEQST